MHSNELGEEYFPGDFFSEGGRRIARHKSGATQKNRGPQWDLRMTTEIFRDR